MSASSTASEKTPVKQMTKTEADGWSPSTWRKRKAKQQPVYADANAHQKALDKLETLPPLVTMPEATIPLVV
jgi:hypothetical protein